MLGEEREGARMGEKARQSPATSTWVGRRDRQVKWSKEKHSCEQEEGTCIHVRMCEGVHPVACNPACVK